MIAGSLISDEFYDNLPDDPEVQFVLLAQEAWRNYRARIEPSDVPTPYRPVDWDSQYVYQTSAFADALGIMGLESPDFAVMNDVNLQLYHCKMEIVVSSIKVRKRSSLKIDTLVLPPSTKSEISKRLEQLRSMVVASSLSDGKKQALLKRIEAVESELEHHRSRMTPVWLLVGAFTMAPPWTSFAADAPEAIQNTRDLAGSIASIFEEERRAQDAEDDRRAGRPIGIIGNNPKKLLTDQSGLADGIN